MFYAPRHRTSVRPVGRAGRWPVITTLTATVSLCLGFSPRAISRRDRQADLGLQRATGSDVFSASPFRQERHPCVDHPERAATHVILSPNKSLRHSGADMRESSLQPGRVLSALRYYQPEGTSRPLHYSEGLVVTTSETVAASAPPASDPRDTTSSHPYCIYCMAPRSYQGQLLDLRVVCDYAQRRHPAVRAGRSAFAVARHPLGAAIPGARRQHRVSILLTMRRCCASRCSGHGRPLTAPSIRHRERSNAVAHQVFRPRTTSPETTDAQGFHRSIRRAPGLLRVRGQRQSARSTATALRTHYDSRDPGSALQLHENTHAIDGRTYGGLRSRPRYFRRYLSSSTRATGVPQLLGQYSGDRSRKACCRPRLPLAQRTRQPPRPREIMNAHRWCSAATPPTTSQGPRSLWSSRSFADGPGRPRVVSAHRPDRRPHRERNDVSPVSTGSGHTLTRDAETSRVPARARPPCGPAHHSTPPGIETLRGLPSATSTCSASSTCCASVSPALCQPGVILDATRRLPAHELLIRPLWRAAPTSTARSSVRRQDHHRWIGIGETSSSELPTLH